LVLWFVIALLINDVGEMMNVMETTQLDFFWEIQIFTSNAPVVCLDLQVVEHVEQPDLLIVGHV
jgi:hypothetical protein